MAGLDTLNITNSGLLNINKKIVNSRTFSSNLITTIGDPTIINGIASGFSSETYFVHSLPPLEKCEKLEVTFKGVLTQDKDAQVLWEMQSADGKTLTLTIQNSNLLLTYDRLTAFNLKEIVSPNQNISILLTLTSTTYDVVITRDDNVTRKTGLLDFLLPLTNFVLLTIGNNSSSREFPYLGSVDLNNFSISTDGTLIYTPSIGDPWYFSHILISDLSNENLSLSDTSQPVANHIYRFPVTEIERSGNTVLLICRIDEDAYLTIREIGLYIQTPDGISLFGSISNLNVNKTKGLFYDLIFTVNTTINVVNAVGFPAENSITVKDPDFIEFKDFTTVQQVNTYVLTNLERIIRMNAGGKGSYENSSVIDNQAGIGHNRPQVIYRLQQQLEAQEDCFNSVDTFVQLQNKFQNTETEQVDYDSFLVSGDLIVPLDGIITNLKGGECVQKRSPFKDTSSWEACVLFSTKTSSSGTIFSLSNGSRRVPLTLNLSEESCSLKVLSLQTIDIPLLSSFYIREPFRDTTYNNTDYFAWSRIETTIPFYNFHCEGLSVQGSPSVSFPKSTPVVLKHQTMDTSTFTFSTRVKFTNVLNNQYLVGKEDLNEGFEIFLEDGSLKANIFTTDETLLLSSRYILTSDRFYTVTLSFDGVKYSLSYEAELSENTYPEQETVFIYSSKTISLDEHVDLIIGSRFLQDSSNPLSGVIDFSSTSLRCEGITWRGCSNLNTIYTLTDTPTDPSVVFDTSYFTTNVSTEQLSAETLIDSKLFKVQPNTSYRVKILYSEDSTSQKGFYRVLMQKAFNPETEVFSKEVPLLPNLSNRMDIPTTTYIGNSQSLSNPYSGIINLLKCNIRQGENVWTFSHTVPLNTSNLLQYYRIPNLNKNQYSTKDMCNLERNIRFLENEFEGNSDLLNLSYPEGLTLCAKVFLQNAEPKVVFYKSDLLENIYCALTFLDQTLEFRLSTNDGDVLISKKLEIEEYSSYVSRPILISIIFSPSEDGYCYVQMYKNEEPISDKVYVSPSKIDPSVFVLSNYLENMPTYEIEVDGQILSKTVEPGKYIQDLVIIQGSISDEELHFINNLFGTTYH